ncbi:hypothetical protein [Bacillus testis]|uniref:hypothetical protein n=1 Tax=Bacillus testis TaxID=1622072 RepID=UPI00067EBF1F|nr:hypothetical protein [Bacillus testis]
MMGLLISQKEREELEYLLKRELDEMLYEIKDEQIDGIVKRAIEERYQILFILFSKITPPPICMKYIRRPSKD